MTTLFVKCPVVITPGCVITPSKSTIHICEGIGVMTLGFLQGRDLSHLKPKTPLTLDGSIYKLYRWKKHLRVNTQSN